MGAGYNPASRAATPEPQSSWSAPVETPSYSPSASVSPARTGAKSYQMGAGYNPANRGATPEPQSSWSAPVETPSYSPPAAPAGGKISYGRAGYDPKPCTLNNKP